MKTLVIVAHPNLARSRINRRWVAQLGTLDGSVTVHDIVAAYPDRRIDIAAEQALVEAHQRVIFQFPLHWYSVPGFLKQWVDDVLAFGWAYGPGGDRLAGKEFGLALSAGGKTDNYEIRGLRSRFTIDELLSWFERTADFVGAVLLPRFVLYGALADVSDDALEASAIAYAAHILEPLPAS